MKKLLVIIFLLFIHFFRLHADELYCTIDSLYGKAEIQRAGQEKWCILAKNTKMYNNDIVRVYEKSFARIKTQDNSVTYVHQNSQIVINIREDSMRKTFSYYTTVFFGAAYFVIKKTLPKQFFPEQETKIYTPTSIIAIRGTSLLTAVNKTNGETSVSIINGVALVQNILQNQSLYLSAGYKTEVKINAEPLQPQPLIDEEIVKLKTWVGDSVIAEQMNSEIQQAKDIYNIITGNLENKIIVMPFVNTCGYKGTWKIPSIFMQSLVYRIKKNLRLNCETFKGEESQQFKDILKAGADQKATYVIAGEIRKLEVYQRAEINANIDTYKEYAIARICIQISLTNVKKKTVVFSNEFCDESSNPDVVKNDWPYLKSLAFDENTSAFNATLLGQVFTRLMDQSSTQLSRYLQNE